MSQIDKTKNEHILIINSIRLFGFGKLIDRQTERKKETKRLLQK